MLYSYVTVGVHWRLYSESRYCRSATEVRLTDYGSYKADSYFFSLLFKTTPLCVALAAIVWVRLTLNLWLYSSLYFLNAKTKGMSYHTQLDLSTVSHWSWSMTHWWKKLVAKLNAQNNPGILLTLLFKIKRSLFAYLSSSTKERNCNFLGNFWGWNRQVRRKGVLASRKSSPLSYSYDIQMKKKNPKQTAKTISQFRFIAVRDTHFKLLILSPHLQGQDKVSYKCSIIQKSCHCIYCKNLPLICPKRKSISVHIMV